MPQFSLRTLAIFTALLCASLTTLRYPSPVFVVSLQMLWPALLIIAACLVVGCRGAWRSMFIGFLIASIGAYYWDNAQRAATSPIPPFSRSLAENLQPYLLNGYVVEYDGLTTFSLDPQNDNRVFYVKKDQEGKVIERGQMMLQRVQNFGISKSVLPVQPDRSSYTAIMKMLLILWIGAAGAVLAFYADQASKRGRNRPPRKKKDPPEAAGLD